MDLLLFLQKFDHVANTTPVLSIHPASACSVRASHSALTPQGVRPPPERARAAQAPDYIDAAGIGPVTWGRKNQCIGGYFKALPLPFFMENPQRPSL